MTLKKLVLAQPALQKLILLNLPLRCALSLVRLIDKANVYLSFYAVELLKAGDDTARVEELQAMPLPELDELVPVRLPISDDITLTAQDCKLLEGIVIWEDNNA